MRNIFCVIAVVSFVTLWAGSCVGLWALGWNIFFHPTFPNGFEWAFGLAFFLLGTGLFSIPFAASCECKEKQ